MKGWILSILGGAALFAAIVPVRTQAESNATPIERLQQLKDQRAKHIEAQAATLQKLEELQKDSQQLRIFARRT